MTLSDPLPIPQPRRTIDDAVTLPGSKSYTNRALPIAAIARGDSQLRGVLNSDDTRYMVNALNDLGVSVVPNWEAATAEVAGCDGTIPHGDAELFLGNSGTSMRFLVAIVVLGSGTIRLDGTQRMRQRPLAPLIDGLRSLGVSIASESGNGCPPVIVEARGLPGGTVRIPGDVSSQYFSAMAMVLPYASQPLTVEVVGELVSKPYIDMTADTMQSFGVTLHNEDYKRLWVDGAERYEGRNYNIEPDASAASYFFALAAVTGGRITVNHLPPDSRQGDVRFVDLLERMGCGVVRGSDCITVSGGPVLRGIDVDMNDISDTVQTLAAIAPFADAPVHIRNVKHIRYKETDRLAAVATELRRAGIQVVETEGSLTIYPGDPRPADIETYDDHRMAMSFAVMGTRAAGIRILDPSCVAKTVPGYWDLLFPLLGHERLS